MIKNSLLDPKKCFKTFFKIIFISESFFCHQKRLTFFQVRFKKIKNARESRFALKTFNNDCDVNLFSQSNAIWNESRITLVAGDEQPYRPCGKST